MNPYDELEGDDDFEMLPRPRKHIPAADVDLLRLAARAIGAELEEIDGEEWVNLHFPDGSTEYHWNPLVHGDNALNLAVDLGLQVFPTARTVSGQACVAVASPVGARLAEDASTMDLRDATRRTITRAAAEIGKNL